ncbi:MAG TPA: Xaa-Pro peptidase family protein [Steroidobacteraceae bacterium]|jgi:Xaa-Pro aminopeptidase
MRPEITSRLVKAMAASQLDAVVIVSPENFAYLAGFVVPSQSLMRWRHAAFVVTASGRCGIVVVDMEETTTRAKADGMDVRTWGEFTDRPMAVLASLLSDFGVAAGRIGTEFDYLPTAVFRDLTLRLPRATFDPADEMLARLRQIKTPAEIEHMRRLSRIADRAIFEALQQVTVGSTEMDIAAAVTRGVFEQGADNFKLLIVATGERSVFPNVGPTQRQLKSGDICRVEVFAIIDGYHAGVCRTARVGPPPAHAEAIWRNLIECKYLTLEMVKPGASSRAIYEAFIRHLSKLKLPPISFLGHGIGLHLHEKPYLGPHSDVPLEAGMVLGFEPLVYNTGYGFGMQNKDVVAVTEDGSSLLSDVTNTDNLIEIQ